MKFAGVGSRQTPDIVCKQMTMISQALHDLGWILRSGHADGADMAFEVAYEEENDDKEIFLPWFRFNDSISPFDCPRLEAYDMAEKIHPAWDFMKYGGKSCHARNCHQILGWNLDDPVDICLCFSYDESRGGTSTAIKLARQHKVPVINIAKGWKEMKSFFNDLGLNLNEVLLFNDVDILLRTIENDRG